MTTQTTADRPVTSIRFTIPGDQWDTLGMMERDLPAVDARLAAGAIERALLAAPRGGWQTGRCGDWRASIRGTTCIVRRA